MFYGPLCSYMNIYSGLRFVAVLTDVCRFRCRPFHKSTRTLYNKMSTDMRCFTRPHVHANFDFDGIHGFDTSLSITIRSTFTNTGQDVQCGTRRFKLWSPNSSKFLVYPGTRPAAFSITPPLQRRRTDGSGGRYDWMLIPQHLDMNYLHHPFIHNPSYTSPNDPEFAYLTLVWKACGLSKGRLDQNFYRTMVCRAASLEMA